MPLRVYYDVLAGTLMLTKFNLKHATRVYRDEDKKLEALI